MIDTSVIICTIFLFMWIGYEIFLLKQKIKYYNTIRIVKETTLSGENYYQIQKMVFNRWINAVDYRGCWIHSNPNYGNSDLRFSEESQAIDYFNKHIENKREQKNKKEQKKQEKKHSKIIKKEIIKIESND